jgi:hypothetical protein
MPSCSSEQEGIPFLLARPRGPEGRLRKFKYAIRTSANSKVILLHSGWRERSAQRDASSYT